MGILSGANERIFVNVYNVNEELYDSIQIIIDLKVNLRLRQDRDMKSSVSGLTMEPPRLSVVW